MNRRGFLKLFAAAALLPKLGSGTPDPFPGIDTVVSEQHIDAPTIVRCDALSPHQEWRQPVPLSDWYDALGINRAIPMIVQDGNGVVWRTSDIAANPPSWERV